MSKIREWSSALLGLALAAAGVIGLVRCPSDAGRRVSEAVFLAGALTITVDPFLKRRLLKEAANDIFHYLLGFDLPDPIKERLKNIVVNTELYRKDMTMTCTFTEVGGQVRIEFETRYEVVNPTYNTKKFKQSLAFEKAENPRLKSISCIPVKRGYGINATLSLSDEEVWEYNAPDVKIESSSRKTRYWFSSDYSLELPSPGFHVQTFGFPTIGFILKIRNRPASLRVSASPADSQSIDEWVYNGLFMAGDHVQIRWEPIKKLGDQVQL